MKKLFVLFAVCCCTLMLSAQTAEPQHYYRYCLANFDTKGGKYQIYLKEGLSDKENLPLTDAKGNVVQFQSWIGAMNYLSLQGWTEVAHETINEEEDFKKNWLLKKEVSKKELEAIVKDTKLVKQKR